VDADEVYSLKAGERAEEGEDSPHFDVDGGVTDVDEVREGRAIERERELLPRRTAIDRIVSDEILREKEGD
jgi:hypothetical protein